MYLWKYWRESRISFAVGLVLVGLLFWGLLKMRVGYPEPATDYSQNGVALNTANSIPSQIFLVNFTILTLPLGFLALRFGSFGVGRDLGEGSGSFLFSRPRSHAFFVWSDWTYGIAQLLLLVLAANAVLAFGYHRLAPDSGPVLIAGEPVSLATIFVLHCVFGALFVGLIYGLTYFTSVLVKSRGVLLSLGIIVGYVIGKSIAKHYWPEITLPDFTLPVFSMSESGIAGFVPHLGLEIILRSALVMAFPIAAQILVQTRDID
jgi:hypothetical protein